MFPRRNNRQGSWSQNPATVAKVTKDLQARRLECEKFPSGSTVTDGKIVATVDDHEPVSGTLNVTVIGSGRKTNINPFFAELK